VIWRNWRPPLIRRSRSVRSSAIPVVSGRGPPSAAGSLGRLIGSMPRSRGSSEAASDYWSER
jgi:hypothetical protein